MRKLETRKSTFTDVYQVKHYTICIMCPFSTFFKTERSLPSAGTSSKCPEQLRLGLAGGPKNLIQVSGMDGRYSAICCFPRCASERKLGLGAEAVSMGHGCLISILAARPNLHFPNIYLILIRTFWIAWWGNGGRKKPSNLPKLGNVAYRIWIQAVWPERAGFFCYASTYKIGKVLWSLCWGCFTSIFKFLVLFEKSCSWSL